jgi:hypothetical protein
MIYKLSVILGLMLLILSQSSCGKTEKELELDLETDHDIYKKGADITANLYLSNTQQDPILVNKRMGIYFLETRDLGEVAFIITAPSSKEISYGARGLESYPEDGDYSDLGPGQTISRSYILNRYYYFFDEIGQYSIQAVYHNYRDPSDGRIAWKGEIRSDIIHFTITP